MYAQLAARVTFHGAQFCRVAVVECASLAGRVRPEESTQVSGQEGGGGQILQC